MNVHVAFYSLILLAGVVWGVGDSFLNLWAKSDRTVAWLIGGLIVCNMSMGLFVYILSKGHSFAFTGVFFGVAYNVAILLISWRALHEAISPLSWLGLIIACTGIVIASIGR